ncbi:MAG: hypothetical protein ACP5HU_12425 [Phycisphaerae bacterium]
MKRWTELCAVVLLAALVQGCIEHHPVGEREMSRLWTLHADPGETARPYRPSISGTRLPGRWIIRYEESLLRSTISIVQAAQRFDEDQEVIDLSVSAEHAEMLSGVLTDTRDAIEQLRELRNGRDDDYRDWSDAMASVLAQIESIARRAGAETPQDTPEEPVGLSAGPMLEMLVMYANERTGGQLLGDLGPGEAQQLRNTLGQIALRMGFALAGRELDTQLRNELMDRLRESEDPYAAEDEIAAMLLESVQSAAPAPAEDRLSAGIRSALSGASKAITVLDGFVRQWDKVDRIEAALLQGEEGTVVEAVLAVKPGREVRMVDVMPFQPVVAFRGVSRITVVPEAAGGDDVVVCFESNDANGGVQLRFEGLVYGLARLLVIPIDSGRLREVRITSESPTAGTAMTHVTVLMESLGGGTDRRRALVYKEVEQRGLRRRAFSVEYPEIRSEHTFSYVTPTRRYSFYRSKEHSGQ